MTMRWYRCERCDLDVQGAAMLKRHKREHAEEDTAAAKFDAWRSQRARRRRIEAVGIANRAWAAALTAEQRASFLRPA